MKQFGVILFLLAVLTSIAHGMAIDEEWVFSTTFVVNQSTGKAGTGFFVTRNVEQDKSKIFLVSNKHVLALPEELKQASSPAKATLYITIEKNGELSRTSFEVLLRDGAGKKLLVEHPSEKVDVAALDVTDYVVEKGQIKTGCRVGYIPESRFSTKESIRETYITIGDPVVILGYPLSLMEGQTAIPLARGGTIASAPDRQFQNSPKFLIDCPTIRGSSGSPVFVPVRPYKVRKENGKTILDSLSGYNPELLGIVSGTIQDWELVLKKTRTLGIQAETTSVAGSSDLGIVFPAATISETLDASGVKRFKPVAGEEKPKNEKEERYPR